MRSASRLLAAPLTAALLLGPAQASAEPRASAREEEPWTDAGLGLLVGSGAGVSASYLLARQGHGLGGHPILYGTGVGAASGLALGLGLGLVDRATEGRVGFGVLATLAEVGAFGAILGGVTSFGHEVARAHPVDGEPGEFRGDSLAVGAAGGALVGMGLALLLVPMVLAAPSERGSRRFSLALAVGPRGMPLLLGRY